MINGALMHTNACKVSDTLVFDLKKITLFSTLYRGRETTMQ